MGKKIDKCHQIHCNKQNDGCNKPDDGCISICKLLQSISKQIEYTATIQMIDNMYCVNFSEYIVSTEQIEMDPSRILQFASFLVSIVGGIKCLDKAIKERLFTHLINGAEKIVADIDKNTLPKCTQLMDNNFITYKCVVYNDGYKNEQHQDGQIDEQKDNCLQKCKDNLVLYGKVYVGIADTTTVKPDLVKDYIQSFIRVLYLNLNSLSYAPYVEKSKKCDCDISYCIVLDYIMSKLCFFNSPPFAD